MNSTGNETQNEKKTLDKRFNVIDVINKTYKDSTEYDLNDALIYLTKIISTTKIKNKQLVKANFSKFVECRIILEEILFDMKKKGLNKDFPKDIKDNITNIKKMFHESTSDILSKKITEYSQDRKNMIINKYHSLFNIKDLLSRNIDNHERFSEIYKEAEIQYKELYKSQYVQKIWTSIKDIRIRYLENIYNQIEDPKNTYTEVLYYFDLYFSVSETKTNRKIMNTLLLNFKYKALDVSYVDKGLFLKEISYLYLKTMIHLDKELQKELTKCFLEKAKVIFSESDTMFIKIWIHKFKTLMCNINVDLEVSSVYNTKLKSIKKELIDTALGSKNTFDELKEKYVYFEGILDKDEIYLAQNRLVEILSRKLESQDFSKFNKIEEFTEELDVFDNFIKSNGDLFENYSELKKNTINREIKKEIKTTADFFKKTDNKVKKLIKIVKLIDGMPRYYKIILQGVFPYLKNDLVVLYYISKFLEVEPPMLNNQQQSEVEGLKKQFGFLMTKN